MTPALTGTFCPIMYSSALSDADSVTTYGAFIGPMA